MAIKSLVEIVREPINESGKACCRRFGDAVKPIYRVTDKSAPEHIGSALLLTLPEERLLLTAAQSIGYVPCNGSFDGFNITARSPTGTM